jgi:hypothetical protein
MDEAQIERQASYSTTGQIIGYVSEKCLNETGISLTGVPREVFAHCGTLAFKAKKGRSVHYYRPLTYNFVSTSIK